MSRNLYWEPTKRQLKPLPTELKWALQKKYKDPVNLKMDYQSAPYLEGLRDAGMEGAQELLDAIEKHEEIDVYEQ